MPTTWSSRGPTAARPPAPRRSPSSRRRGRARRRSTTSTPTRHRRRSATWPRRGRSPSALGERAATVPVSGTKALYGHPLGASGAIEAAIAALTIHDGWAPASVNLPTPDDEVGRAPAGPAARAGATGAYRRVLSTSFGFGGLNAALVLGSSGGAAPGQPRASRRRRRQPGWPARWRAACRARPPGRADPAPPDEPTRPHGQRQDAADGDRAGDAGDGGERAHEQATDRDRRGEDRGVDAHHPAAQAVRDGQLDRRVGRGRHGDAAAADEDHEQERERVRTPTARAAIEATPRMIAPRAMRTGRGRPPTTSATAAPSAPMPEAVMRKP